jgi:transcriptional regulator with XRE-family HTH domain
MANEQQGGEVNAFRITVARNIKTKRIAAGLTLQALAEKSGCSPSTIALIEAGRSNAGLATIVRIAAALGAELADIFRSAPGPDVG